MTYVRCITYSIHYHANSRVWVSFGLVSGRFGKYLGEDSGKFWVGFESAWDGFGRFWVGSEIYLGRFWLREDIVSVWGFLLVMRWGFFGMLWVCFRHALGCLWEVVAMFSYPS